ncbi:MAG: ATP-binding protein [Kiritimatiellia bacterium]
MSRRSMEKHIDQVQLLQTGEFWKVRGIVRRIAHDFNNLLTPFTAYPELIKSELPENSHARGLIDSMSECVDDMLGITSQLFELANPGSMGSEMVHPNLIVREVLSELQGSSVPEGVTIHFAPSDDTGRTRASTNDVSTAVRNICINAVEAAGPEGEIRISTEAVKSDKTNGGAGDAVPPGDYIVLKVKDTGKGVPEAIAQLAFEPFVTTKKKPERRGAGLGLSVAYMAVHRHGGYLNFENSAEGGAEFRIYLPRSENAVAKRQGAAVSAGETAGGRKVLIVDDEENILKLFQRILSESMPDVEVDTASDGSTAVEMFGKTPYQALVLDLHMPGMSGTEVFGNLSERCRKSGTRMPGVLFCTGFAPSDSDSEIVTCSPERCLLFKPISADVLVDMVRKLLKS